MLAEFIDKLLQRSRCTPEFKTHPGMPDSVFLVTASGEIVAHEIEPKRRTHTLLGLKDLLKCLVDHEIAPAPEVYVARNAVTVLLDRNHRHETIVVPLALTQRWSLAMTYANEGFCGDPKEVRKKLKNDFHSAIPRGVLDSLSRIDFSRTSSGHSHVEHGKESLGRSVEAVVQQAKDVPEEFDIRLPVWSTEGFDAFAVALGFSITIEAGDGEVEVRLQTDEAERAMNQALRAIRDEIVAHVPPEIPVLLGTP